MAEKPSFEDYLAVPMFEEFHKKNFLLLEGKEHGSYSYPDLLVAKTLSHHGKNWYQSHEALHQEGMSMPTLRQFVDFLNLLKSGKAFDGKGQQVSSGELEAILKEITEQRNLYRAEWLDADFKVINNVSHINYAHQTINGKLQPKYSEPLQGWLMEDKQIDLEDYLKRATFQGLPPVDVKSGRVYYWKLLSDNNSVAGFWAVADRVDLGCRRNPQYSDTAIGVRRAQAKI
ncbi:hypothetical protein J4417_03750 [Candidatus Woesearchaeota archaeon]|nr:hypothetical protein [Candidatus Woesearchaeota archaeon]